MLVKSRCSLVIFDEDLLHQGGVLLFDAEFKQFCVTAPAALSGTILCQERSNEFLFKQPLDRFHLRQTAAAHGQHFIVWGNKQVPVVSAPLIPAFTAGLLPACSQFTLADGTAAEFLPILISALRTVFQSGSCLTAFGSG